MIVTFFLKLGTFFINYFGKLDPLINTLAYVRHFDILCINKLCQIGEDVSGVRVKRSAPGATGVYLILLQTTLH
jgi:hypothetical protein